MGCNGVFGGVSMPGLDVGEGDHEAHTTPGDPRKFFLAFDNEVIPPVAVDQVDSFEIKGVHIQIAPDKPASAFDHLVLRYPEGGPGQGDSADPVGSEWYVPAVVGARYIRCLDCQCLYDAIVDISR